ncbi:hypothetical protein [Flavobacterium collinsii]|uniref:TonB-dependent receptor plug domain-containing protein n=1 Tax=Flavobacterium collinsii TaxID=1114861 RepID=A0ABM8KFM8_9FLAO|nr:hypothetical protein [Flavobacterium collinsii]CAA9196379.1 hypothetical protein FLACOL7796_01115 [Flavobacterium collinsii]
MVNNTSASNNISPLHLSGMKRILLFLSCTITIGCSNNPHTFILNDKKENKYFIAESINQAFEEDLIEKSPLIVINGVPFRYNKKQDTILLPLKKSDIISLDFLNKNSSRIIYNEKENDGAIIITARIKTK